MNSQLQLPKPSADVLSGQVHGFRFPESGEGPVRRVQIQQPGPIAPPPPAFSPELQARLLKEKNDANREIDKLNQDLQETILRILAEKFLEGGEKGLNARRVKVSDAVKALDELLNANVPNDIAKSHKAIKQALREAIDSIDVMGGKPITESEVQKKFCEEIAKAAGAKPESFPVPPGGLSKEVVVHMATDAKFILYMEKLKEIEFNSAVIAGWFGDARGWFNEGGQPLRFSDKLSPEEREMFLKMPDLVQRRDAAWDALLLKYRDSKREAADSLKEEMTTKWSGGKDIVAAHKAVVEAVEEVRRDGKKLKMASDLYEKSNFQGPEVPEALKAAVSGAVEKHKKLAAEYQTRVAKIILDAKKEREDAERRSK